MSICYAYEKAAYPFIFQFLEREISTSASSMVDILHGRICHEYEDLFICGKRTELFCSRLQRPDDIGAAPGIAGL